MKYLVFTFAFLVLFLCSCRNNKPESANPQTEVQDTLKAAPDGSDSIKQSAVVDSTKATARKITKEMAYEGVDNYCHSTYDWSVAKDNPSIMYVQMGEETDSEYEVVFRSYTGAYIHFYVDKTNGTTRIIEIVPNLDVEEAAGTINLFDYLEKKQ